MIDEVKERIIDILNRINVALKDEDPFELRKLSNHTIHNASIYQDEDSISIALLAYSLSKIIDRSKTKENKMYMYEIFATMDQIIVDSIKYINKENYTEYRGCMNDLFALIKKIDDQIGLYVEEIIDKARINKSSVMYEHGISLGKSASVLGISQWELMAYVGKTQLADKDPNWRIPVIERLNFARKLFGVQKR